MDRTKYKRNDVINFFTIEKFAFFHRNEFDFALPYPSERHDFFELQYMHKGSRVSIVDGKAQTIKEGQFMLVPPNVSHMLTECSSDANCYLVGFTVFRPKELRPLSSMTIELGEDDRRNFEAIFEDGVQYFTSLSKNAPERGSRFNAGVSRGKIQTVKNRFEIFFIKLIESQLETLPDEDIISGRMSVAEYVLGYLKSHITDKVTLSQISDSVSLSIPYICREFRKEYEAPIIDYFLDMKIERSKQLIEETSLNFTQIAEYLSFESESHFSKTFSKRVGMAPGTYLKRIKEQNSFDIDIK